MPKKTLFAVIFFTNLIISINAQTYMAVPIDNPVYIIIEQAQMRGLCAPLPGVKPYSREKILSVIDEIISNSGERRFGALTKAEIVILEQFKTDFNPKRGGLDLVYGTISFEHTWKGVYLSGQFGFGMDFEFSGAHYNKAGGYYDDTLKVFDPLNPNFDFNDPLDSGNPFITIVASHPSTGDSFTDYNLRPIFSFIGDIGNNLSYGLTLSGWAGKTSRGILGIYNNFWEGFEDPVNNPNNKYRYLYQLLTIRSEPYTYFPYTHKKRWDGFVWPLDDVSSGGMVAWPEGNLSVGYSMMPELAGTFFNGHFFYRFARLDREWAGMTANGSLVLSQSAQPFLAFETVIQPFDWISFSSLTGALEYHNATGYDNDEGMSSNAQVFQNAFSIVMLELNIKKIIHIDFGTSVVWPKRLELGYLFPFADNLFSQNNIGDFDNLALFLNLQAQYPGLGKVWLSLYLDEVNLGEFRRFFQLDRMMHAIQIGGSFHIPWLPFSSARISYTKIEPYNYSHWRTNVPWYSNHYHGANGEIIRTPMEQNYVSFGRSLGHYLPPNADEILFRIDTIPFPRSMVSFQYQLIRHGADYGPRAVDGSSLWSELDPSGRSSNPALEKYFLRDGAYQWMHIIKFRGEYSFVGLKIPLKMFAEIGGVYSYFTDIDGPVNSGSPKPYSVLYGNNQYPHTSQFIAIFGVQLFPKF